MYVHDFTFKLPNSYNGRVFLILVVSARTISFYLSAIKSSSETGRCVYMCQV